MLTQSWQRFLITSLFKVRKDVSLSKRTLRFLMNLTFKKIIWIPSEGQT